MVASGVSEMKTPGLNFPIMSEKRGGDRLAVRSSGHRSCPLPAVPAAPGEGEIRKQQEGWLSKWRRLMEWRGLNI